ncbi:MAG: hypothetical protein B5M54_05400 [Candidatus Aminicenantes bacterium 4484_214]|nr:MAG: hypothetical protein B5M54_05400 [Candidatus Aminicenantes bacterium 4484_214]
MKILHTSDIHLQTKNDDRWVALTEILKVAQEMEIDYLLIAGDLFDRSSDAEKLKTDLRQIFSGVKFEILVLPGNHDQLWWSTSPYLGERVKIFTRVTKPIISANREVAFFGLPFEPMSREKLIRQLQKIKPLLLPDKVNILAFHGELLDAFFQPADFGDEGRERYLPVKLDDFQELNLDYILAGHFHTRFEIFNLTNGGYFVYPGSPISLSRKELGKRKACFISTGKPPQEVCLRTSFYEEIEVILDPTQNDFPLKIIDQALSSVAENARIILKVRGFFDGQAFGLTEQRFQESLEQLKNKYPIIDIQPEYYDFQRVAREDLFQEFKERLARRENLDESTKRKMMEVAIKALIEAIS